MTEGRWIVWGCGGLWWSEVVEERKAAEGAVCW